MHIITGLGNGGAESCLYRLCANDNPSHHVIVSLLDGGKFGQHLAQAGCLVLTLNCDSMLNRIISPARLGFYILKYKPDVVQTWMYHADLLGGLIARVCGVRTVLWGIRRSFLISENAKPSTALIVKSLAFLSYIIPHKIVACAHSASKAHERIGYCKSKLIVINNGFSDCPSSTYSLHFNHLLSTIKKSTIHSPILGMLARYHPDKDHNNLLACLVLLKQKKVNFSCFLAGPDMTSANPNLVESLQRLDLLDCVSLVGEVSNPYDFLRLLDIHILSSATEGFPNVLAEAMLVGTPCVSTDVGDSSFIIDNCGWVCPSRDPKALADALCNAISLFKDPCGWQSLRAMCRHRILIKFGLEAMADAYNRAWVEG